MVFGIKLHNPFSFFDVISQNFKKSCSIESRKIPQFSNTSFRTDSIHFSPNFSQTSLNYKLIVVNIFIQKFFSNFQHHIVELPKTDSPPDKICIKNTESLVSENENFEINQIHYIPFLQASYVLTFKLFFSSKERNITKRKKNKVQISEFYRL